MAKNEIKIRQGITLEHFFPGIFILIAGIVIAVKQIYLPGILVFVLGLIITLSLKGVLIDLDKMRIRRYYDFLFFKAGEWIDINGCKKIYLSQTTQSQSFNFMWRSNTINTKSFDVYLINEKGNKIELKEFTDYKKAQIFLKEVSSLLEIEPLNKIQEARNRSIIKRKLK